MLCKRKCVLLLCNLFTMVRKQLYRDTPPLVGASTYSGGESVTEDALICVI